MGYAYNTISRMYDGDYDLRRTPSGDVDFYVEEAKRSRGPIAEFGCGTGRILVPIHDAGIEAVGVDLSPAMLEQAREKRENLELHVGDMRDFGIGREFALVTIPFRALSHVIEAEDHRKVFANMRRHLAPEGRLVFDVFQPNPAYMVEPKQDVLDFEREEQGQKIRRYFSVRSHKSRQVNDVVFRWEIEAPDGSVEELREEFPMRWFSRFELEHALARAGLEVEQLWGDFKRGELEDDSPEFIFVARRATN